MKELSVEEKAKRYDEALEKSKRLYEQGTITESLCYVFPELKESEDERIRGAIIHFISHTPTVPKGIIGKETMLAWLEKQGEQKSTLPKWKYKKDNTPLLRDSLILNKYGCVAKSPSGALVSDVWVIDYDELAKLPKEEIEKQGEKRPADKIEPKFNVGDEIRTKNEESLIITRIDRWGYWSEDLFICNFDDADKWELVEQKHAWSEEDEINLDGILNCYKSMDIKWRNWLKSIKDKVQPKQEWSEEDEHLFQIIIDILDKEEHKGHLSHIDLIACIRKLKSLRPQKQWKPSDEQMKALNEVVNYAANHENMHWNDYIFGTLNGLVKQLKNLTE